MTSSSRLVLNKGLIHAPIACIDYVIIHEPCHIQHPNYSIEFWKIFITILGAIPEFTGSTAKVHLKTSGKYSKAQVQVFCALGFHLYKSCHNNLYFGFSSLKIQEKNNKCLLGQDK
jgi:hypothetical protein